jgi:hypothetical protein
LARFKSGTCHTKSQLGPLLEIPAPGLWWLGAIFRTVGQRQIRVSLEHGIVMRGL